MKLISQKLLCLHKFEKCDFSESLPHPHAWDMASCCINGLMVCENFYEENFRKKDLFFRGKEPKLTKIGQNVCVRNNSYSMENPRIWHKVTPLKDTYTIMINGPTRPSKKNSLHTITTKGKELSELGRQEKIEFLEKIMEMLGI